MFYDVKNGHGLPHNPFKAIVAPRPIGWISTRSSKGDNLAPYSFFNAVNDAPMQVIFAGGLKDSLRNVQESGVFAVNVVSAALVDVMSATSKALPHGVDEFAHVGIEKGECQLIDCPFVVAAPAVLECRLSQMVQLGGAQWMAVGDVVAVRIRDEYLRNGRFDVALAQPAARLGYRDYDVVTTPFELMRPDD